MDRLFCQAGQHFWNRETKRGRKPANCPKHSGPSVVVVTPPAPEPKPVDEGRIERLEEARAIKEERAHAKLSQVEQAVAKVVDEILANPNVNKEDKLKLEYIRSEIRARGGADSKSLIEVRADIIRKYFRKLNQPVPEGLGIKRYWT